MAKTDLTAQRLRELLHYDPETGIFYAKKRRGPLSVGKSSGTITPDGYVQISLHRSLYLAHRLAWLYVFGEFPSQQIDHKDRDGTNNRIENLRLATGSQNNYNKPKRADNTSGHRGVCYVKRSGLWEAKTKVNGKRKSLGRYKTPQEAGFAYEQFAKANHGEFFCRAD